MATEEQGPKYPDINVKLVGENRNTFFILGAVKNAMRRGKASPEDTTNFQKEAMSGDYNNLLQTAMKYVNVQ